LSEDIVGRRPLIIRNTPVADVDDGATDMQAAALDLLDRLAALPPIQRVRDVARTAMDVRPGRRLRRRAQRTAAIQRGDFLPALTIWVVTGVKD
jgi:hypothetical protein